MKKWRERVRIEHTKDGSNRLTTGFEVRAGHQTGTAPLDNCFTTALPTVLCSIALIIRRVLSRCNPEFLFNL